mmetsp:Transcript_59534/g.186730  ORF Transcript_59534/g.186730 Transcript_59534/m.186730 type:complete len:318 (-) Transcript_59534:203-1156(-)
MHSCMQRQGNCPLAPATGGPAPTLARAGGLLFPAPGSQCEVGHAPPSLRVDETVGVYGTAASVSGREHSEALEAEFRVAVAAHHLVTLRSLRLLLLEVLLCHGHAAGWTLLCPGLLHPAQKLLLVLLGPAVSKLLGVLLAREASVVGLHTAADAGGLLAEGTLEAPGFTILQRHAHRAARRGARPEVGLAGDCLLQAAFQELVNNILGQQLPQVMLRDGGVTLRAGHAHTAHLQPRLSILCHAVEAIPTVLASQPSGTLRRDVITATDGTRLKCTIEAHDRPKRLTGGRSLRSPRNRHHGTAAPSASQSSSPGLSAR